MPYSTQENPAQSLRFQGVSQPLAHIHAQMSRQAVASAPNVPTDALEWKYSAVYALVGLAVIAANANLLNNSSALL